MEARDTHARGLLSPPLTPLDDTIATIIGRAGIDGVVAAEEGDLDGDSDRSTVTADDPGKSHLSIYWWLATVKLNILYKKMSQ